MVWAARKGHLECVRHLLATGADVDQEGAVSIFSILTAGNRDVFSVFRERIFFSYYMPRDMSLQFLNDT